MIALYVIDKDTGFLLRSDTGNPASLMLDISDNEMFVSIAPPENYGTWRWMNDKWVELLPINNPDVPYDDSYIWDNELNQWIESPELAAYRHLEKQEQVWGGIKERRLQEVTSGVLVKSVNKIFHTDETSAIQYSSVAGMIALNNYEPIQWKVMDNSWVLLTKELFIELQKAMNANTQATYAIAEQHKESMMLLDDPSNYDFSTGWTNGVIDYN